MDAGSHQVGTLLFAAGLSGPLGDERIPNLAGVVQAMTPAAPPLHLEWTTGSRTP